jgi:hypothetical protein
VLTATSVAQMVHAEVIVLLSYAPTSFQFYVRMASVRQVLVIVSTVKVVLLRNQSDVLTDHVNKVAVVSILLVTQD